MKPFIPDQCTFEIRLTLFDRQVALLTDSKEACDLFQNFFGGSFFAPIHGQRAMNFYMSTKCHEPWSMVIAIPDCLFVAMPSDDKPGAFNIFRHYPDRIEPCGQIFWDNIRSCLDLTIELFATYFKRRIFDYLLSDRPWFRLIHAASVSHDNSGIMFLAPTKGGKTTLSLACAISGMKFLSDDLTLVDIKHGLLIPFPRALRVREDLYKKLSVFRSIPSGLMLDVHGEKRYYIQPENIHKDAVGEPVKLSHFIVLRDINSKPSIKEADMESLPEILVGADCFVNDNPSGLVWQWMTVLDKVQFMELSPGHPMETARFLLSRLDSSKD